MRRPLVPGLLALALAGPLGAQAWDDPAAAALAERAIRQRAGATADSTLVWYGARAHGLVTFLTEIGDAPARLVKLDELDVALEWTRRGGSRQTIRAWRDTTFFPNALHYHRDHLGIVSEDFGDTIRIGEGDEVRDVLHPLAPGGPERYQYRLGDTLRIASGGETIVVVALDVRPRWADSAAVVGRLYLELDRAAVVRSDFSFTPAAYRDRDLEDIAVRLERALFEGRHWLPLRQEIEIRRRSALLEVPLRGVIRGRWALDDHRINEGPPPLRVMAPAIGGLTRPGGPSWPGPIVTAIDSAAAPIDRASIESLRTTAARTLGRRTLDGLPPRRFAATGISDLARVNRVEGLRLGLGVAGRLGPIDRVAARVAAGTSDGRVTGSLVAARRIGRATLALGAERWIEDVGDVPAASGLMNSLAAQEGGRDLGDYVLAERVGLELRWPLGGGAVTARFRREWAAAVAVAATPARGEYRPNPALDGPPFWSGVVALERASGDPGRAGRRLRLVGEVGGGRAGFGRVVAIGEEEWELAGNRLVARGLVGGGAGEIPARRSFLLGGPGTVPGHPFRAHGGRGAVFGSFEWLVGAPGPAIPLGAIGRTAARSWVGPMLAIGWAGGVVPGAPWRPSRGLVGSVGLALELFERIVRVELAQRVTGAGGPTVTVDFVRAWWPIL